MASTISYTPRNKIKTSASAPEGIGTAKEQGKREAMDKRELLK